jgi:hypothetical protein
MLQTEKQRGGEKVIDNAIFKDYLAQIFELAIAGHDHER